MGVDVRVHLPANVRLDTVARVMAAYAGGEVKKSFFENDSKSGWSTRVDGYKIKSCEAIPSMVEIIIEPGKPMVDGENLHHCFYHFEPSEREGGRLMMPRSTAFWIALMTKVVDFFGGTLDYQDCDSVDVDYTVPAKSWEENSAEDGAAWYALQNRILSIKPITKADWKAANKHAAYKIGDR